MYSSKNGSFIAAFELFSGFLLLFLFVFIYWFWVFLCIRAARRVLPAVFRQHFDLSLTTFYQSDLVGAQ